MARIKKYSIKSQRDEEVEFEITRITKTTNTLESTMRVDDNGNIISARAGMDQKNTVEVQEAITAVSLPSRTPAAVIIEETTDANKSWENKDQSERPEPAKIDTNPGGRGRPVNIDKTLYPEESKEQAIPIPKPGEINWVK